MAAEEDSEECTSKLLSTITQTTSSGGAKVPDGVWGGQEFREIRFEICYAVHFSVARNFVRN